jgi:hypothetical protein
MVAKKVKYTCGCEAEGDLISTFCQIHGNPQETSPRKDE